MQGLPEIVHSDNSTFEQVTSHLHNDRSLEFSERRLTRFAPHAHDQGFASIDEARAYYKSDLYRLNQRRKASGRAPLTGAWDLKKRRGAAASSNLLRKQAYLRRRTAIPSKARQSSSLLTKIKGIVMAALYTASHASLRAALSCVLS